MNATIVRPVATVKPFRIRMGCGHVEIRMMREALAGMTWTPGTEHQIQTGARCAECCPSKEGQRAHQRQLNAEHGL